MNEWCMEYVYQCFQCFQCLTCVTSLLCFNPDDSEQVALQPLRTF